MVIVANESGSMLSNGVYPQRRSLSFYFNEDLTAIRASLAYDSRMLKKQKKIHDCWTTNGKILIKDRADKICVIESTDDLKKY